MNFEELEEFRIIQQESVCHCGKKHESQTDFVILKNGILEELNLLCQYYSIKNPVIVFDKNTEIFARQSILKVISGKEILLKRETDLIPNERAVFEILSQIPKDTDMLFAVGSGTINDLTKYASYLLSIPYICIATAPSMDGFVSSVSPLNVFDTKITYSATVPKAVIADLSVLKNAPMNMIAAGVGDILGKFTAIADWKLSKRKNGEYYCSYVASLINDAVTETIDSIDGLISGDERAVGNLLNALILSGTAISYIGNSRPASGAEHHLAHYFEILFIKERRPPVFHGTKVALGLLMALCAYDLMKNEEYVGEIAATLPSMDTIKTILQKINLPISPYEIGLSREQVYLGLTNAYKLRDRYTIMHYAHEIDRLEEIAEAILDRVY